VRFDGLLIVGRTLFRPLVGCGCEARACDLCLLGVGKLLALQQLHALARAAFIAGEEHAVFREAAGALVVELGHRAGCLAKGGHIISFVARLAVNC
jgi:hypothetical protein